MYKPTGRRWVKLWVQEWLGGSTRFELSIEQRAIFIDLLALAGNSRLPGTVCSGLTESGAPRPYPMSWLAGNIITTEANLLTALNQCRDTGKLSYEMQQWDGQQCPLIVLTNWARYQSEYERQKRYRNKVTSKVTPSGVPKLHTPLREKLPVEGEGEGEERRRVDAAASTPAAKKQPTTKYQTFTDVRTDEAVIADLCKRFPDVDIAFEVESCEEWHKAKGKMPKAPLVAVRNWCKIAQGRADKTNGKLDPGPPP